MVKIISEIGWNHMGDMELAKKMMQLISSYELRKKFGNQSKIQNKQFKLNVILDKWITLLK